MNKKQLIQSLLFASEIICFLMVGYSLAYKEYASVMLFLISGLVIAYGLAKWIYYDGAKSRRQS